MKKNLKMYRPGCAGLGCVKARPEYMKPQTGRPMDRDSTFLQDPLELLQGTPRPNSDGLGFGQTR
jgi:hypothetical protein